MAIDGTYDAGKHTVDVSPAATIEIEFYGVGGEQGENAFGDSGVPGDGGNGGQILGEIDVDGNDTLTIWNADGRTVTDWSNGDGGQGGAGGTDSAGDSAGDGGYGGGACRFSVDGTVIAIVDGGGGGGGAGTYTSNSSMQGGGGGGGGSQGGLGGSGGQAGDGNGDPGGDGDGSGSGGDGGDGGDADFDNYGQDGTGGTVGGVQILHSGTFITSNPTTGGSTRNSGRLVLTVTSSEVSPPSNLAADGISTSDIELSWDGDSGADSYNIYRSATAGVDTSGSAYASVSHPTTTYTDSGLPEGQQYYYAVTAVDGGLETKPSNEDDGTTILPAPTDLSIANIDNDGGDLSWTLNSTDETGVLVEARVTGGSWSEEADLSAGTEAYTLTGLLNGRDYETRVAAYTNDVTSYDQ
jgi:hypothetical protein